MLGRMLKDDELAKDVIGVGVLDCPKSGPGPVQSFFAGPGPGPLGPGRHVLDLDLDLSGPGPGGPGQVRSRSGPGHLAPMEKC